MKEKQGKKNKEENIYQREAILSNRKKAISIVSIVAIFVITLVIGVVAIVMDIKEDESKKQALVQNRISQNRNKENEEANNQETQGNNSSNQTTLKALEMDEKIEEIKSEMINGIKYEAPIPKGYIASPVEGENKISTGLVIYEDNGEGSFDGSNETAVENAQKTRNQYVWVPVTNPSEMYGTDSKGKKWGKLYDFETSSAIEDSSIARNWTETNGIMQIESPTYYREPDILKNYDKDSKLKTYGLGSKTAYEFQMELEKEFERMIASVEKYGGFYIGRYETGDWHTGVPVVVKGNSDISANNNSDKEATWYAYYQKSKKLAGANVNVRTSMIWGSQWDACLKWMLTSEDEQVRRYVTSSTERGNYTGSKKETGSNDAYSVNNIYDMTGNVSDWTIEAINIVYRVIRRKQLLWF